jgi:hypothetical protein
MPVAKKRGLGFKIANPIASRCAIRLRQAYRAKLNEKQFGDAWEQDGFTLTYE